MFSSKTFITQHLLLHSYIIRSFVIQNPVFGLWIRQKVDSKIQKPKMYNCSNYKLYQLPSCSNKNIFFGKYNRKYSIKTKASKEFWNFLDFFPFLFFNMKRRKERWALTRNDLGTFNFSFSFFFLFWNVFFFFLIFEYSAFAALQFAERSVQCSF